MKHNKSALAFLLGVAIVVLSFPACKPDLTGTITSNTASFHPGEVVRDSIEVVLQNAGMVEAKNVQIDLVLSTDTIIPIQSASPSNVFQEDQLLPGGREFEELILPSDSVIVALGINVSLPDTLPIGSYYLAAVFDPGQNIDELNESNNVALMPIEVESTGASTVYFDVDFGTPPHTVGQPPVAEFGELPLPIRTVSSPVTGAPLVAETFGALTDQPLVFDSEDGAVDQIRFSFFDIPNKPENLAVDFDVLIESMEDDYGFSVLFDTPNATSLSFRNDGVITAAPGNVGNFEYGQKLHFRVEIYAIDYWKIFIDGEPAYEFTAWPADEFQSVRFSTETINPKGVRAAIDNVVIQAISPAES